MEQQIERAHERLDADRDPGVLDGSLGGCVGRAHLCNAGPRNGPRTPPVGGQPFTSLGSSAAGARKWPPHSPSPRTLVWRLFIGYGSSLTASWASFMVCWAKRRGGLEAPSKLFNMSPRSL